MGIQVSYLFKSLLSVLWGTYPEVALLTILFTLKGIHCLCFGIQPLHQTRRRKKGRIRLANYIYNVAEAGSAHRAEYSEVQGTQPVKGNACPTLATAAEAPQLPHLMGVRVLRSVPEVCQDKGGICGVQRVQLNSLMTIRIGHYYLASL